MDTFKNAYVFLPDSVVRKFAEREKRSEVFSYKAEKEPLWKKIYKKLRMFIWGGRDFLKNIEEDVHIHVRFLHIYFT